MVVCFTLRVSILFTNTPATVLMLQSTVMHKFPVDWIPSKILTQFDHSHLSVAHWEAELVIDMCRHMADMCHVSGTMSIIFLVKFYPILTPHTPL